MIRVWLWLLLVVAVIVVAAIVGVWGDPGSVSVTWGEWRLDATAAWLSAVLAIAAFILAVLWEATGKLAAMPRRSKAKRASRKREQANEAAAGGFAALAADDPQRARDHAAEARRLDADSPLTLLLTAQTAEATGDAAAAEAAWTRLSRHAGAQAAADAGLARLSRDRGRAAAATLEALPPIPDDPGAPATSPALEEPTPAR